MQTFLIPDSGQASCSLATPSPTSYRRLEYETKLRAPKLTNSVKNCLL